MKRDVQKLLLCGTGRIGSGIMRLLETSDFSDFVVSATINKGSANALVHEYIKCDAVIDFSHPSLTGALLDVMRAQGAKPCLIGTTGFTESVLTQIMSDLATLALHAPILYSSNLSIGVHVINQVLPKIRAALLQYDVKIIDMHHKSKKDAPSGTAMMLAEAMGAIDVNNDVYSIRCGDIVGVHEVLFASEDEIITVRHEALHRNVFSKNALKVMRWLLKCKNGLYSMQNFCDISDS